jgi:hypothetical protein
MKNAPIRKVAAAGVAFAITYAARRVGIDLGSEAVTELAQGAVTLGAAYLVKDPRVVAVEQDVEKLVSEHPALTAELHDLADRFLDSHKQATAAIDAAYAAASKADVSASDALEKVQGL